MEKIGIVTYYYGSSNYGGLLQAYALAAYLIKNGYDAKQICVYNEPRSNSKELLKIRTILCKGEITHLTHLVFGKIIRVLKKQVNRKLALLLKADNSIIERKKAVEAFRVKKIPHTERVYTQYNIGECDCFDIYITGSDQVWRGITSYDELNSAFWLSFVSPSKKRISYAASISRRIIPQEAVDKIRNALSEYTAISVRERTDKTNLEGILDRNVEWVLDPTMLFTRDDWEKIACEKRIHDGKYVFAYLLGNDKGMRKWIRDFAYNRKLDVVFIPYVLDEFRSCDYKFGNARYSNISPEKWISLIRDAEYIITDSFHGTVFSILFNKNFLAFRRDSDLNAASGNNRLYSLLSLLNLERNIIDVKHNPKTIRCDIGDAEYMFANEILRHEREKSGDFLIRAIESGRS